MMNEQLKKDIEAIVAEIFSQKEEAEKKLRTEEALQKAATTITELTEALEAKNVAENEAAVQIASLQETIQDLTSKLEAAKKEIEDMNTKLISAENVINDLYKDKAAEVRMQELVYSGIALSNKEAQFAKVRNMSDEEFAAYKDELLALRKAVEAELSKNLKQPPEEAKTKTADVPPPAVKSTDAVKAALNVEARTDTLLSKYSELGTALAQRMTKKK